MMLPFPETGAESEQAPSGPDALHSQSPLVKSGAGQRKGEERLAWRDLLGRDGVEDIKRVDQHPKCNSAPPLALVNRTGIRERFGYGGTKGTVADE